MPDGTKITPEILSGWKDIAHYLGKGVRTVQRYERDMQLPARRPSGTRRGSVLATRADLDNWVATCPTQHRRAPKSLASREQIAALKKQIRERHQLFAQMSELRANLRLALILLSENVQRVSVPQDRQQAPVVAQPGAVDGACGSALRPQSTGFEAEAASRFRRGIRVT